MFVPDKSTYQQLVSSQHRALEQIDLPSEEGYLVRFATFSANLTNFLPQIPVAKHPLLFKENLFQVALETTDRSIPNITDFCNFEGEYPLITARNQPFIFCSFHLGSYRILAAWLIELGYDYSILVRDEVYAQHLAEIQQHDQLIKSMHPSASDVQVINAEDPTSLIKILRQLRAGRSLVVYMDGNSGSGEHKGDLTRLLNQQIFAKQGAAFLSYLSDVSMLPVFAYRRADYQNVIVVESPILPDKTQSKELFAHQTTQYLYDRLGEYIQRFPAQWEPWSYVHHQLHIVPSAVAGSQAFDKDCYSFNHQRFSLFLLKDGAVVFDREQYIAQEISTDLYEYLSQSIFTSPQDTLGEVLCRELIENHILI